MAAPSQRLSAMTINAYLGRLNAGFRIDYREPDYRGKEPAASYQIHQRRWPSPRSAGDALDQPSFRNTLSAGDKSTLALALYLAKISADPALKDTIVVLDDPFTSLDHFRRQFTAIEIRKLCGWKPHRRSYCRTTRTSCACFGIKSTTPSSSRLPFRRARLGMTTFSALRRRSGHAAASRHRAHGNRGVHRRRGARPQLYQDPAADGVRGLLPQGRSRALSRGRESSKRLSASLPRCVCDSIPIRVRSKI